MIEEQEVGPVVHVLVSEPFFYEKVDAALRALKCEPRVPAWTEGVLEQLAAPAVGLVADLEDEKCEVLAVLRQVKDVRAATGGEGAETAAELPILAYCSHNREDLIEPAEALGVKVVARSTFAANLVRLLMELVRPSDEPAEGNEH